MTRLLTVSAVVLQLCIAGPAFAQAKAKATAPEIPFDSVPNFFKLPAGLYMGEGKREEIDEIRHEDDPDTIFRMEG